jgi:hypothetical protein
VRVWGVWKLARGRGTTDLEQEQAGGGRGVAEPIRQIAVDVEGTGVQLRRVSRRARGQLHGLHAHLGRAHAQGYLAYPAQTCIEGGRAGGGTRQGTTRA